MSSSPIKPKLRFYQVLELPSRALAYLPLIVKGETSTCFRCFTSFDTFCLVPKSILDRGVAYSPDGRYWVLLEKPDPQDIHSSHYDLLGVKPTDTIQEMRRAFHRKVKTLHPDLHGDAKIEEFLSLVQAYRSIEKKHG